MSGSTITPAQALEQATKIYAEFIDVITRQMEIQGVSQADLGRAIGCHVNTVSRAFIGTPGPTLRTLFGTLVALGIDVALCPTNQGRIEIGVELRAKRRAPLTSDEKAELLRLADADDQRSADERNVFAVAKAANPNPGGPWAPKTKPSAMSATAPEPEITPQPDSTPKE